MKRRCIHPELHSFSSTLRGARGGVDVVGASEPVAPGASVPSGSHSYDYLLHSNVIGVIDTRFEFLFHSEPVINRQQLRCDRVKLEILVERPIFSSGTTLRCDDVLSSARLHQGPGGGASRARHRSTWSRSRHRRAHPRGVHRRRGLQARRDRRRDRGRRGYVPTEAT